MEGRENDGVTFLTPTRLLRVCAGVEVTENRHFRVGSRLRARATVCEAEKQGQWALLLPVIQLWPQL